MQAQDPMIVFLSETCSSKEHMKWVRYLMMMWGGGGLALLWKAGVDVWVDTFSKYHIDSIVHGGSENTWRLTRFYGEPDIGHRNEG